MILTDEQRRAIGHDGGDALVSASAGSGKTFVMIQRLIRLILEEKADVDGILAVTFTNMAAAEMKEKLVRALTDKINDPTTSPTDAERLKAQLALVPAASICTFHSFCKDLIRNYFYEPGLDASFAIADEVQTKLLKSRAADAMFADLYAEDNAELKYLLSLFSESRSDLALKEHISELYDFFETEAYPEAAAKSALDMYTKEGLKKIKAAFFAHYRVFFISIAGTLGKSMEELKKVETAEYFESAETIRSYALQLAEAGSFDRLIELSRGISGIKLPNYNRKHGFPKELWDGVRAIKERLYEEAEHIAAYSDGEGTERNFLSMRRAAEGLVSLAMKLGDYFSVLKREENVLDFADLEHFALSLLDNPAIAESVRAGYKYVFADEYQDTNGVQEEILKRITRDNAFMVGDVKQSIYAFRGCNPKIFEKKFSDFLRGDGEAMTLSAGFRSAGAVIDLVNGVFSEIMTEDICGSDYSLAPMTGGNGAAGEAELHVVDGDKENVDSAAKKGVYSVKEHLAGDRAEKLNYEGLMIASLIRDTLSRPVKLADGSERELSFGDVVILVRGMGAFTKRLAETLEECGIPVSCTFKKSLVDYPEIKQLISLLKLIDSAREDLPLIACMRGPVGGFTDSELAEIRAFADGRGADRKLPFVRAVDICREQGEGKLKEKLDAFFAFLDRLRFISDYEGAGRILSRAIRERGIDLYYSARPNGNGRLKRIEKLVREATGDGNLSVRDFLDRIDAFADESVPEAGGDDSVRIMTIHASKGLEFPVVIAAGLGTRFSDNDMKKKIVTSRELGFAIRTYDDERRKVYDNIFSDLLKRRFRLQTVVEEERIFYVALTRAQYRLYLTETAKNVPEAISGFDIVGANCYAKLVSSGAVRTVRHTKEEIRAGLVERSPRSVLAAGFDQELEKKLAENLSFKYPFDTTLAAKSSVTAVVKSGEPKSQAPPVPVLFEEGADARETGNAYHRFMELADFKKPRKSQLIEQKRAFSESGKLPLEWAELVDEGKIERVLEDEFFGLEGAEYFRELPFEALVPARLIGKESDDEVLIQGVIDVIAFAPDGLHIADYKVSSRSPSALAATYAKQLELYAFAAERITGRKVVSKTLFNLLSGEKIPLR